MPHVGYWIAPRDALALQAPVVVASMDHAAVLDSGLGDRYVSNSSAYRPTGRLVPACGDAGLPTTWHCELYTYGGTVAFSEHAMTPPELALVVPCYNEASRLEPDAFLQFVATHPSVQLVLVDDGSSDGTGKILQRMHEAAPAAVTVLRQSRNLGKAEAVRAGILAGLGQRAALVGFFDADSAMLLGAVDDFLAVLRDRPAVEFVLGSRVLLLGRDIKRKATRHYFGRVFATAVSHALDLPVYDTQCGANILRANAATATLFDTPFRSAWIFDVELIARYLRLDEVIPEVARVILLRDGRIVADGPKAAVLTAARLTDLFGTPIAVETADGFHYARPSRAGA